MHRHLVLVGLVLAAVLLGRLGAYPLFDVDEGAFAEASREMLVSGDWGHTTLNGADRFDKPILVYWLQAISLHVWGVNAWAARLPSALCALLTLWALGLYARPSDAAPARWTAAALLGTSVGFLLIGRAATADALLNLLLVLGGLKLAAFVAHGQLRDLRWAAFWLGLGTLTKGPVALLIPGATLALWSLFSDRGGRLRQALTDAGSWLLLLGTVLPWYLYAWHRHGMAFVEGFFYRHNLDRFSGPLEGHGGGLFYYLLALPLLWLPWSLLLPLVVRHGRRWWAQGEQRFLLIWAGFVIGFFTLSGTKLPHYALYAGMPLALLMARALDDAVLVPWLRRSVLLSLAVTPLLLACVSWLAPQLAAHIPDAHFRQLLASAPPTDTLWVWTAVTLGVCTLPWWLRQWTYGAGLWLPACAVAAHLTLVVVPWWGETLQGPVKAAGLWAAEQGIASATQWNIHQPSVGFYRQAATPRRAPEPGEWALTRQDRYAGPASQIGFASRGWVWVAVPPASPVLPLTSPERGQP